MEYPTDLELNENKDIFLDGANDLATVTGPQQLEQSAAISVLDELDDFVSGRLTGENIGLLEERVRQGLNDDPQLGRIRNVSIKTFNRDTELVTISVQVAGNDDFTLQLNT